MRFGVLGTGLVGTTIATKLVDLGHNVCLGSRDEYSESAALWASDQGRVGAACSSYADAAAFGEVVFNCTPGVASIAALVAADADNLRGKILIDVANPLNYNHGDPPTLTIGNHDSLGELIQRTFPETRVVKTLNTVGAALMVDPERIPGKHVVYLSGNDRGAKVVVASILREGFGWHQIVDLGDITTCRAVEAYRLLWASLYHALGEVDFNMRIEFAP